jgi:hypothetical protein
MKILYLHNFGELDTDIHYDILRQLFPDAEVTTVAANYTESPIMDLLFDIECIRDADYIVGVGYGAFLAYLASIVNKTKTILVDPYIPMDEYLVGVPYMDEHRDTFKSLWENNKGENKNCHVLLDATKQIPDLDKTFAELKDIADIYIYCDSGLLTHSSKYETWLRANIS